jgi:UDP-3-O-[3-hydroxymyristoyl] glucosamine N-acyltransferase
MTVTSSKIADFIGGALIGPDVPIKEVASIRAPKANSLLFLKRLDADLVDRINALQDVLVLVPPECTDFIKVPHIVVENPRLTFARVVAWHFAARRAPGIASTAKIAGSAELGKGVSVGEFCVIGDDVFLGDDTEISHNVVIGDGCRIGQNCLIKSGTVIGQKGFGFEPDEDGRPVTIPHLGKVILGDYVEIGALNTVARGTMDDTIVSDWVKTDDHVHIAHNVHIGENTLVTACSEISGSVTIGRNVWLGPNCCIMNGIEIGDGALIGLGSVVTSSVEPNNVVAGNPARFIRKRF